MLYSKLAISAALAFLSFAAAAPQPEQPHLVARVHCKTDKDCFKVVGLGGACILGTCFKIG